MLTKAAVVTGAASGIGQATVAKLRDAGWRVWGLDLNITPETAQNAIDPNVRYLPCDVSSEESLKSVFSLIRQETPAIDALICSAGVIRTGPLMNHSSADFDVLMKVNVKGPWLTVREAFPLLKKSADHPASRVVLLGSISAIRPKVGGGFYAASKAGVHAMAGVMAVELAEHGILVNVVAPGTVETPMNAIHSDNGLFKPSGVSPLGRIATTEDVTKVIEFFLSDASNYVTGTVLPVDGGTRAAFVKQ